MAGFQMPALEVGDMVLFYDNPFSADNPVMGWVSCKPGTQTIKVLVYAEDAGFVEKPSVRHRDDPFWRENETAQAWQKWGAFALHPNTELLKELKGLLTKQKIDAAKKKDAAA
jgi:hypothetical protein